MRSNDILYEGASVNVSPGRVLKFETTSIFFKCLKLCGQKKGFKELCDIAWAALIEPDWPTFQ